jgi:hypothetical protein
MNQNKLETIPDELRMMILQVLEVNQYDANSITANWVREVSLDDAKGVLAIIRFHPEIYVAVLNVPIVVMPVYGKILNLADVMQLVPAFSHLPSAQFALKDNILFFTICLPQYTFKEEKIPNIVSSILKGADEIRTDLLAAIRKYYQLKTPDEWSYPEPVLPNIKMTPREMQIIDNVLSRCDEDVQKIFTFLVEKWAKAGFIVATTPQSIVLDVPYGDRTARLAMLFGGVSEGLAALRPAGYAEPPVISLFWGSLRKYQGLPTESVDSYQKTVQKITALRLTESSAHIDVNDQFELATAKALLKAMKTLGKSVRPELVEEPPVYSPVTPDNIQITLASCSEQVQAIYRELMESWKAVDGTVQSPRPGRIYLRMETKAHRSGKFAQIARKFNLAVLAGPRGKKLANLQIQWDLSRAEYAAYLDCIPDEVARFEHTVMSLPGFERKGTITYLWMDETFQLTHARSLCDAMRSLKTAEEAAI